MNQARRERLQGVLDQLEMQKCSLLEMQAEEQAYFDGITAPVQDQREHYYAFLTFGQLPDAVSFLDNAIGCIHVAMGSFQDLITI